MTFKQLVKDMEINFSNEAILTEAFTHSSYVNEHQQKKLADNERLEFLGDAVLELAVSEFLFKKYPDMNEGDMTRLRANIVCEESLYFFAKTLQLQKYVLLGKGEERTGGRNRQALLADVFESFLGAMYLDKGMAVCQKFLEKRIFPHIASDAFSHVMDYKTKLQEMVQKDKDHDLKYAIIGEDGPSHAKKFIAQVQVNHKWITKGTGESKKIAQQKAAKKMIDLLQAENKKR